MVRPGQPGRVSETAESAGILVGQVLKSSPADKAGMEPGDTVVRINGEPATAERLGATARRVRPGETVRLDVRRAGHEHSLTLVAAERPSYLAPEPMYVGMPREEIFRVDGDSIRHTMRIYLDSARFALDSLHVRLPRTIVRSDSLIVMQFDGRRADTIRLPRMDSLRMHMSRLEDSIRVNIPRIQVWRESSDGPPAFDVELIGRRAIAGAAFRELGSQLASYFGVREGLLVDNVASGTPASKAGLQAGDVVTAANGRPIGDIADLRRAVGGRTGAVKLDLVRKGKKQQVELKWP